jgi:hypothetical protein
MMQSGQELAPNRLKNFLEVTMATLRNQERPIRQRRGCLKTAFSASSRMFDLDGEASTARTKQISAIIAPT